MVSRLIFRFETLQSQLIPHGGNHWWKLWPSLYNQGGGSFWSQQSQGRCSRIGHHSLCTGSKLRSKQSTSNTDSSQESKGSTPLASWVLTWLHEGCRDFILFNSDLQDLALWCVSLPRIKCKSYDSLSNHNVSSTGLHTLLLQAYLKFTVTVLWGNYVYDTLFEDGVSESQRG